MGLFGWELERYIRRKRDGASLPGEKSFAVTWVGMDGLLYVSACLLAGRGVKLLIYLYVLSLTT